MNKFLLVIFCSGVLMACKNPSNFEGGSPEALTADAPIPQMKEIARDGMGSSVEADKVITPADQGNIDAGRKIIRDGNIMVVVKDVEDAKSGMDSLVRKFRAYYSAESYNNTEYEHNCYLTIRIPAEQLDRFITSVEKGIGEIQNKNITTRDVTEEYIDLETRLKNKESLLNRYQEILKQAKSVKDILEIQKSMNEIEEEIDSAKGRLKYLNNLIGYSTLNVQLLKRNEFYPDSSRGNFIKRLKTSVIKGWRGLISFTLFVVRAWPLWLILGVLYYAVRKYWKRKRS